MELYTTGNAPAFDAITNDVIVYNSSAPSEERWGVDQGLWSFNTPSTYDLLKQSTAYVFQPITSKINVPVLVNNAVDDEYFPGQAMKVYNKLKKLNKEVTLHNFRGPVSHHCEAGDFETSNAIFGWLEDVFYERNGQREMFILRYGLYVQHRQWLCQDFVIHTLCT
jgi:hypothetical protein